MEILKGVNDSSKVTRHKDERRMGKQQQQQAAEATLKMIQAWLGEKFIPHYAN